MPPELLLRQIKPSIISELHINTLPPEYTLLGSGHLIGKPVYYMARSWLAYMTRTSFGPTFCQRDLNNEVSTTLEFRSAIGCTP